MISNRRAKLVESLLIAILCLSLTVGVSPAQTDEYGRWINGVSEPWHFDPAPMTKEEIAVAQARWQSIEGENKNDVVDEWAGDYFIGGDTHGSYLRWSPQAGFVLMNVDKCRAAVMNLDYGKAIATNTLVQFFPQLNKKASGHGSSHATSTQLRFIPVKWRGEHFLVGENEIADFGEYVAGLGKYNDGAGSYIELMEFFVKLNDVPQNSSQLDMPIVPTVYERYMRKPIDAKITAVGSGYREFDRENDWWDNFLIPVRINVGTAHGVKKTMTFKMSGSQGFGGMEEKVTVTSVGLRSSKGVVSRTIRKRPCVKFSKDDDCESPSYNVITVGMLVTTRPF